MTKQTILQKSLNEIKGLKASKGPYETSLVERCEQACATPLQELTNEQIRLLLSQKIVPEHILPLAIPVLVENPFLNVTFYPGDLLKAALELGAKFWADHNDLWYELKCILDSVDDFLKGIDRPKQQFMTDSPYGG